MYGVLAGGLLAIAEIVSVSLRGGAPLLPVQLFASVSLGGAALDTAPLRVVVPLGLATHALLSTSYGALYGALYARLDLRSRTSLSRQALLGIAFGLALFTVHFQGLGRLFYPWLLEEEQALHAALHALAFGLPLALMVVSTERQLQLMLRISRPTRAQAAPGWRG